MERSRTPLHLSDIAVSDQLYFVWAIFLTYAKLGQEEILPLCLVKVEHVWIEIAKIFADGIVVVCQRFDRAKIITRRMRRS